MKTLYVRAEYRPGLGIKTLYNKCEVGTPYLSFIANITESNLISSAQASTGCKNVLNGVRQNGD